MTSFCHYLSFMILMNVENTGLGHTPKSKMPSPVLSGIVISPVKMPNLQILMQLKMAVKRWIGIKDVKEGRARVAGWSR